MMTADSPQMMEGFTTKTRQMSLLAYAAGYLLPVSTWILSLLTRILQTGI
jgi:hypothetical protein